MAGGGPDCRQLLFCIDRGLTAPRGPQRLADPFRDRHPLRARGSLNLAKLGLLEKNLQSLAHTCELSLLIGVSQHRSLSESVRRDGELLSLAKIAPETSSPQLS